MGRKSVNGLLGLVTLTLLAASCQSSSEDTPSVATTPKKLYVASGVCYSGAGITTYTAATASRAITTYSLTDGSSQGVFTDLNIGQNVSVNTVPQDMIDKGDHILLLTENATTTSDRRIFKIYKNNPEVYITYANDPSAFTNTATHITRSFSQDADGSIIFSKSLMAERVSTLGVRMTKGGANPWVNPLAATGTCFTAAGLLMTKVEVMQPFTGMNQGKIIYLHSGATAVLNRIGVVQRTGLTSTTAADCAGASPAGGASTVAHTNAPNLIGPVTFLGTGTSQTGMVYIPTPAPATTTGKLIVANSASVATAFDNSANFNYGIVMWDITETSDTAVTITNPVILWRDESVVWAPSALAYDAENSELYVASGASPGLVNQTTQNYGYNIEKFTLDIATPQMTRVSNNNLPFIPGNAYTKCISNMMIAE
jgi:hypothetical protein